MQEHAEGKAIRRLRIDAGLTQNMLAERIGEPQSFISKIESGERSLHVSDLSKIARALNCNETTIINAIMGIDSILDDWDMSEKDLTELVGENPSLRGMILGYAAELKFRDIYLNGLVSSKDDDHNRSKKGDRRISYKGKDILVEVKSLQTNMVKCLEDKTLIGKTQVDASDRREIIFDDGSTLNTTLLLRGEFDILAVNCFAFHNKWEFVFALNSDLAASTYKGYTEEQRSQLIASLQKVTWPPQYPFTTDFHDVLERAWEISGQKPDVHSVHES